MISWLLAQSVISSAFIAGLLLFGHRLNQSIGAQNVYCLWLTIPLALLISIGLMFLPTASVGFVSQYLVYGSNTLSQFSAATNDLSRFWGLTIWLVPSAVFLLTSFMQYRCYLKRLALYASDHKLDSLPIYYTECLVSPQIIGVFRPKIVVPTDFYTRFTKQQQRLILNHEKTHWLQGDTIWNCVAVVILSVFWFNPMFWLAYRHFRQQQELSCDSKVLAQESMAARSQYGYALIEVSAFADTVSFSKINYSEKSSMKRRIQHLISNTHHNKTSWSSLSLVAVCCAIMGFSQLGLAKSKASDDVKPIYRAEPIYPKEAAAQQVTGWVELSYSIETDGSVSDVVIISAKPQNVFGRSATTALSQWKYSRPKSKMTNMKVVLAYELNDQRELDLHKQKGEVIGVSSHADKK